MLLSVFFSFLDDFMALFSSCDSTKYALEALWDSLPESLLERDARRDFFDFFALRAESLPIVVVDLCPRPWLTKAEDCPMRDRSN